MVKIKKKRRSRPKPPLTPKQLEQALQHVLTSTLAIYVLNRSEEPISTVVKDLIDIQSNAGSLVGFFLNTANEKISRVDLQNTIAGVFSYIPISTTAKEDEVQDKMNDQDLEPSIDKPKSLCEDTKKSAE